MEEPHGHRAENCSGQAANSSRPDNDEVSIGERLGQRLTSQNIAVLVGPTPLLIDTSGTALDAALHSGADRRNRTL